MVYLSEGGPGIFPGGLAVLLKRSAAARGALVTLATAFALKLYWEQLSGPLMDLGFMESLTRLGWLTRIIFRLPVALPFLALLLLIYIWLPNLRLRLTDIDHTPLDPSTAIGSELKPLIYPWFVAVLSWAALDLTGHALIDRWSYLAPHPIAGFFDEPYFRVHLFMLLAKYACWYFGGGIIVMWIALMERAGSFASLTLGYLPSLAGWGYLELLFPHDLKAAGKSLAARLSLINHRFDWSEYVELLALLTAMFTMMLALLKLTEHRRRRAAVQPARIVALPLIQAILMTGSAWICCALYQWTVTGEELPLRTARILESSYLGPVIHLDGVYSRELPPLGPSGSKSGFSVLTNDRFNHWYQLRRVSASGEPLNNGSYPMNSPWNSGWFTPDGWYLWIKYHPLKPIHTLYAFSPSDELFQYDLLKVGVQSFKLGLGNRYPLLARADKDGGWLLSCEGFDGPFSLTRIDQPPESIAAPTGLIALLNSNRFKRRFSDFALSNKPPGQRDCVSRIKYGTDGELYAIDRNGCLWRISREVRLVRLSGGALQRLLGNAPTKPPSIPAYGPWAGSRAAFAFDSKGEGRLFDPYGGVLYMVEPAGGLEPMYGFPVEIDEKKWTDSPYKAPGRLMLGDERGLTQWDLQDAPSSTLDEAGNFYVYLNRLLLFPTPGE